MQQCPLALIVQHLIDHAPTPYAKMPTVIKSIGPGGRLGNAIQLAKYEA